MRVLGISGSLRRDSHNRRLLLEAAELLRPGVELQLYDELKALPPYDEDDDGEEADPVVERLRDAVARADAILIATPEYNSSIPGALKNALDWASRPVATNVFRNKPVAVIGASAGMFGAVWAQAELRKVLATMGARVAEVEVAVGHATEKFDEQGLLVSDETRRELADALATLLAELGVAADGRVVLGETPLDDGAREHADELAVLDDGDALKVLLL